MKYTKGQNEDGHWFASIHDMENPARLLDKKICGSEKEAEELRLNAMGQGVAVFTNEMRASVTAPPPADPDEAGEGKAGGGRVRELATAPPQPKANRSEELATAPPLHGIPSQGGKSPPMPSAHKPAITKAGDR